MDSRRPSILESLAKWIRFNDLTILSLASLPGIKPTCSGPTIFSSKGFNLFARILASNFRSTLRREMGLKLAQSVRSLSGLGTTAIYANKKELDSCLFCTR